MAVNRKPLKWAALGLLCLAASAAAFFVSGGIVGGASRPTPSPEHQDGSIQVSTDISKPGYRVAKPPVVDAGTTTPRFRRSNYLVITSDPQYPWTPEMDGHAVQCGEERACSRALMSAPRILLIDEPSVGLAPLLVRRTIDKIKELKEGFNLTVLMAEQNFTQAVRIADRGYVIVHGKIAFTGDSAEALNNNDLIREFYLGA